MKHEDILKAVIKKAVENGYKLPKWMHDPKSLEHIGSAIIRCNYLEKLIFDHEFAKAFWKECSDVCSICGKGRTYGLFICDCSIEYSKRIYAWRHNLQQLALSKNRLCYLSKFI